jgi:hypothetical protein
MKAAAGPSAEVDPVPRSSLDEIVANYQIDISCTKCQTRSARPIGFLRAHATMLCPKCGALLLLDVSLVRQEMRHIEKQLGRLRRQLLTVLRARSQGGSAAEALPPFDEHDAPRSRRGV